MTAVRLIRDGFTRPGPLAYFTTAVTAAMLVLAVAGYRAHSEAVRPSYLPPDIAMRVEPSGGSVVFASTRPSPSITRAVQPVLVDASAGVLRPNQIAVKAGMPSEATFTVGRRCTERLYLDSLGIEIALYPSGGSVLLPPLQAGTYPITCAHGNVIGLLISH